MDQRRVRSLADEWAGSSVGSVGSSIPSRRDRAFSRDSEAPGAYGRSGSMIAAAAPKQPRSRLRWYQHAFVGIIVIGIAGPLAWSAVDPYPPISGISLARVEPTELLAGSMVKVSWDVTVTRPECDYTVTRSTTDSKGNSWPAVSMGVAPFAMGANQIGISVPIPRDAYAGPMEISASLAWRCNLAQRALTPSRDLPSAVVAVTRP